MVLLQYRGFFLLLNFLRGLLFCGRFLLFFLFSLFDVLVNIFSLQYLKGEGSKGTLVNGIESIST